MSLNVFAMEGPRAERSARGPTCFPITTLSRRLLLHDPFLIGEASRSLCLGGCFGNRVRGRRGFVNGRTARRHVRRLILHRVLLRPEPSDLLLQRRCRWNRILRRNALV